MILFHFLSSRTFFSSVTKKSWIPNTKNRNSYTFYLLFLCLEGAKYIINSALAGVIIIQLILFGLRYWFLIDTPNCTLEYCWTYPAENRFNKKQLVENDKNHPQIEWQWTVLCESQSGSSFFHSEHNVPRLVGNSVFSKHFSGDKTNCFNSKKKRDRFCRIENIYRFYLSPR